MKRAPPEIRIPITVVLDSPDEGWRSMDLAGEMLLAQWESGAFAVNATSISLPIPRLTRRLFSLDRTGATWKADRALIRYGAYPLRAVLARRMGRYFHIVDHSYAHLVRVLPALRTGVYCHDVDAFRPALFCPPPRGGSAFWMRTLASALLRGMRSASVVFFSTHAVGDVLEAEGIVPRSRLVYAPYGVSSEFTAQTDPNDRANAILAGVGPHPFVLHVGSQIQRKRLDVLFELFARLLAWRPGLRLVQQGAALSAEQRAHVERLGIAHALVQPPRLARKTLAGLYRRAAAVLVPSESEGFGLPVIEALACGATVIASDIPVFREVGGDAVLYAPVGDIERWAAVSKAALTAPIDISLRLRRAARTSSFTWARHSQIILEAYRNMVVTDSAPRSTTAHRGTMPLP